MSGYSLGCKPCAAAVCPYGASYYVPGVRLPCTYVQRSYTSTRTTRISCSPVPGAAYLVSGTRYIPAQNRLRHHQRYGGLFRGEKSLSGVTTLLEVLQVLRAERRLPHATEEKEKRSFPVESGSIAKHHPAWNPQRTQKSRQALCPKPKSLATLQSR